MDPGLMGFTAYLENRILAQKLPIIGFLKQFKIIWLVFRFQEWSLVTVLVRSTGKSQETLKYFEFKGGVKDNKKNLGKSFSHE